MEEYKTCPYCHEEKICLFSGKKLKDGTRLYVNAEGARWAGRRCPDCEKERVTLSLGLRDFERRMILAHLEREGFQLKKTTLPFLAEKEGKLYRIGLGHAHNQDGKVRIANRDKGPRDLYILMFASLHLCSPDQLNSLDVTPQI